MPIEERWQLVNEDVTLYAPEISRAATPDEFLDTEESHHTIITFKNVLIGCKEFDGNEHRDDWISRHPMGKRIELHNTVNGTMKAGNIVEVRKGDPPDDLMAAIMIYIERDLAPENVQDWVI